MVDSKESRVPPRQRRPGLRGRGGGRAGPVARERRLRPLAGPCARAPCPGSSTRGHRRPTGCRGCTTSGPASTRTSSAATRRCGAATSLGAPAGTPTACPSRSRSSASSGSRASAPSRTRSGSPSSPGSAASRSRSTSTSSSASPSASATGPTWPTPTTRSPPSTSSPCGGTCKQLFDKGLLYEDLKVVPYCPRCGTALSSHELGQPDVYGDEPDESAYVRLAVTDAPEHGLDGVTHLVVWTTTPWTLLSNVAVAVNPELDVRRGRRPRRGGRPRRVGLRRRGGRRARVPGASLLGLHYGRPFTDVELPDGTDACYVVGADYVTTEEGTGLVHQSPAFGEVDRVVARAHGLPTLNPVGPDGAFTGAVPWLEGVGVRAANTAINDELERARPAGAPPRPPALGAPLLALRDGPHLLGQAELVRGHEPVPGPPGRRERSASTGTPRTSATAASATGWRTTSTGRCRATATGARPCRCGAAATAT